MKILLHFHRFIGVFCNCVLRYGLANPSGPVKKNTFVSSAQKIIRYWLQLYCVIGIAFSYRAA
jgi:hypothetical protein